MVWIIIGVAVLLVVIIVVKRSRGSGDDFSELHEGLTLIQRNAFDHIKVEDESEDVTPPSMGLLDKISFQTSKRFSVVYTITTNEDGEYFHTVSGKGLGKQQRKHVIENMLFLMTVLMGQFEQAKFGEDVKFGLDESEVGTQYVGFTLDTEPRCEAE